MDPATTVKSAAPSEHPGRKDDSNDDVNVVVVTGKEELASYEGSTLSVKPTSSKGGLWGTRIPNREHKGLLHDVPFSNTAY